jgi:predicted DNA-binding transcriptional regulator AlpA
MKQPQQKWENGVPEGYVSTNELRERLGKSPVTIWRMILDGRLPKPLKDGKRNVWDKREIDRWIANGKFLRRYS